MLRCSDVSSVPLPWTLELLVKSLNIVSLFLVFLDILIMHGAHLVQKLYHKGTHIDLGGGGGGFDSNNLFLNQDCGKSIEVV